MKKSDFKYDPEYYESCLTIKEQDGICSGVRCSKCIMEYDCPFHSDYKQKRRETANEYIKLYAKEYKESKMKNYICIDGKKIKISQETADSIVEANDEYVDFSDFETKSSPVRIEYRNYGKYEDKSIYLDGGYIWEIKIDSYSFQCLMAKKKKC